MFINSKELPYKASIRHIFWTWQKSAVIKFSSAGFLAAILHQVGILSAHTVFPSFALAVIGGALGIFVSFRSNSAYQRWWEGRKLWGRLINTSRHICTQAIAYLPSELAQELVYRQITYVHALRCVLRGESLHQDQHLLRSVGSDELEGIQNATNPNHLLLTTQMKRFVSWHKEGVLTEFWVSDLDNSIRQLLDIQGGCERIKKTPFPPAYGFLATQLTTLYSMLLPLCLVNELGWWIIPVNTLICMAFQMINEVGRVLENPFEDIFPALPLSAMSLTIERDLRQALGEVDLPDAQKIEAVGASYVLM